MSSQDVATKASGLFLKKTKGLLIDELAAKVCLICAIT